MKRGPAADWRRAPGDSWVPDLPDEVVGDVLIGRPRLVQRGLHVVASLLEKYEQLVQVGDQSLVLGQEGARGAAVAALPALPHQRGGRALRVFTLRGNRRV